MKLDQRMNACELVALEAQLLDERRWEDWLALYRDDAVLWVPTWKSELELSEDPLTELSFMYLEGRPLLQERIRRATSGISVASMPLPRTSHLVAGAIAASDDGGDTVLVKSSWSSYVYLHKEAESVTYAGRYEHTLRWEGDAYRIQRKKIVLTNDYLVSKLDFFYI